MVRNLYFSFVAYAQTTSTPNPKPKWGIETELIAPFLPEVGIITIKATRTITRNASGTLHGDLLLGAYLRPNVKHDVVEKINEYLITVGYRQYFFKGLHLEAQLDGGYAWGTNNKIDGKDYNNAALLGEVNAGYTFHLPTKKNANFYILPQFGVLHGLETNIGPRGGKSDTFIQGKLLVGIRF
jgi:hypothetical protein